MSKAHSISSAARHRRTFSSSPAREADAPPTRTAVARQAVSTLTILLVGNYLTDQQQSMQLFAELLARELPQCDATARVEIVRPEPFFGRLKPSAEGLGKWLGYLDKFVLFPWRLRRKIAALKRSGASFVVHLCDHSSAPYSRYLQDVPHVVTCHDMFAIRSALGEVPANLPGWSGRLYQSLILRGLKATGHAVCVSEQTRDEFLRVAAFPAERATLIPMGLNRPFWSTPLPERRASLEKLLGDSATRYLLHVGGNQWYKNRMGVLQIYAALRKTNAVMPKLVLAGKPLCHEMRAFLEWHRDLARDVYVLTDVADDELRALYSGAELLLFPSLAEGFGWPVIEAQACGCRVVTSDRAPLTEHGSDAAVYVDPDYPKAAAVIVRSVLEETAPQREARIRRGLQNAERFSAAQMIRSYLATYRTLIS